MATDDGVSRALVVAAHPDDVDFGAAGTVAGWVAAGIEVAYCIVTDGDAGGYDPAVPRGEIPGIRRAEQTAAAKAVGVTDVRFLGYPDGRLTVSLDLRRDLSRVIRQARPDRVVGQWPERNWQRVFASHPDHMAAGEALMCAVYPDSRNPFAFPELAAEGLEPHTVGQVWLMGSPEADTYVDITATFEQKVAALRCHESQVGGFDDLAGFLRGWTAATAKEGGLPDGRLAEGFRAIATG
jgi:LmbE family N-acetylglucosaminyl deacetylase